jgi:hypothetical protein
MKKPPQAAARDACCPYMVSLVSGQTLHAGNSAFEPAN